MTDRWHGVQHEFGKSVDGNLASLFLAANAGVDAGEVLIEAGGDVLGAGEVRELLHELVEGRLGGSVANGLELVREVDHVSVLGLLDVRDRVEHLVQVLAGLEGDVVDELGPDRGGVVDLAERCVLLLGVHGAKAHRGAVGVLLADGGCSGGRGPLPGASGDDAHLGNLGAAPLLGEVAGGGEDVADKLGELHGGDLVEGGRVVDAVHLLVEAFVVLLETGVDVGDVHHEREPVAELLSLGLGGAVELPVDIVRDVHAPVVVLLGEPGDALAKGEERRVVRLR